ncbi:extracellular solute-binding protein [Spirochaetia bacterium 38H-sp]|uniref:Extracellular solute-binding protein n=1 Tax=Rarispira pelagica TaxID=3141764 RepID=A0ABU9UAC3_9SPIR
MRFTDEAFIRALKKIYELKEFFPEGYQGIDYVAMQQMFGAGQAAMFIGGSWEIGIFTDKGVNFDWFAPPLPSSDSKLQYCFHVDAGIGGNKNSKNLEAAKTFIRWAATPEFAQLFMNELPGFFAYTPSDEPYKLTNSVANKMMAAARGSVPTIRTVWERLSDDYSANDLVGEALVRMYNGELTPEETAKYIQDKLDVWYPQIFTK